MRIATTATALALALGLGTAVSVAPVMAAGQGGQEKAAQSSASGQSAQGQQQGAESKGSGSQQMQTGDSQSQQNAPTVAELRQRADELIGRTVVNRDGADVGELSEIVLSKQKNQPHAVIEVGGLLGIGAKEVAISFDELQLGQENITLMSQKSEQELKDMPAYEETQYTPLEETKSQ
jgi:sporulation protein YlmC with PRC-barrel domain